MEGFVGFADQLSVQRMLMDHTQSALKRLEQAQAATPSLKRGARGGKKGRSPKSPVQKEMDFMTEVAAQTNAVRSQAMVTSQELQDTIRKANDLQGCVTSLRKDNDRLKSMARQVQKASNQISSQVFDVRWQDLAGRLARYISDHVVHKREIRKIFGKSSGLERRYEGAGGPRAAWKSMLAALSAMTRSYTEDGFAPDLSRSRTRSEMEHERDMLHLLGVIVKPTGENPSACSTWITFEPTWDCLIRLSREFEAISNMSTKDLKTLQDRGTRRRLDEKSIAMKHMRNALGGSIVIDPHRVAIDPNLERVKMESIQKLGAGSYTGKVEALTHFIKEVRDHDLLDPSTVAFIQSTNIHAVSEVFFRKISADMIFHLDGLDQDCDDMM